MRVGGGNRGFKIHKAIVRAMKDVAHVAQERGPALAVLPGGGSGGTHRFVGNHVAGHSKADLREIMRVGRNRGTVPAVKSGEREGCLLYTSRCV